MMRGTVVPAFLDAGTWSACFGMSWMGLLLRDMNEKCRIMNERATFLRKPTGTGGIPDSRNECCRSFLDATDAEWLWFVDTDMGFAADTVDRLVDAADEHRRPVMGGLCFAQRRTGEGEFNTPRLGVIPTIYDYAELDDEVGFMPRQHYPRDEVTQASATGAACLLIHRRALRKVRQEYGDEWFSIATHPTGLNGKPRHFSEDMSFCVRLAAVGIPVHVDTRVKTAHEKGGIFLTEDVYLAQQATVSAESSTTSAA